VSLPDAEHQEAVVTSAAKPSSTSKVTGPTYRFVLDEKIAGMPLLKRHQMGIDFSSSGDRIVFASQGKLYIADQTATLIRPILEDLGPWKYPNRLRWSPDGRLIAYRAMREVTSDSGKSWVFAIFILSPDGGTPRQIGPDVRGVIVWFCWTPDGRHLTYGAEDGLHTISLDGNEVRLIPRKDLPGVRGLGAYSPNGRWLTYNRVKENAKNQSDTDLCILPATGGTARRLTHLPWFNSPAIWAPDDRTLYFASGIAGAQNIWKLSIDPETGLPKGKPQQVTFFNDADIWCHRVLGDGDRIAFGMMRGTTSIQVADALSPKESNTVSRGRSPQLSPDGQTIYYVNNTPGEEGIYAVPRQGGTPRRLTESLPAGGGHLPIFDVSPDGRTLAYVTQSSEWKGLFTLPASGGESKLLVKIAPKSGVVPQWSPDGSQLAYADGKGLYVIAAAGGKVRELAHLDRGWEEWNVRWSPDGKFLAAFCRDMDETPNPGPQNAVFVVPTSGGELRQLTPDVDYKEGLEWHPDGKRLTYHVSRSQSETRQVYLDGRPPSLLVDAPDIWDFHGIWAPDGRRFFFLASSSGDWGMYAYNEASGETTLVSAHPPIRCVPRWSRDGKTMAWSETRQSSSQTWIMENFLPKATASK
jgi:Tol biopolymer transport system component